MLTPPHAGVGRVDADHRDTAPSRHAGEPVPESSGGDAGYGTSQPFTAPAAAQGFTSGRPSVSEIKILHHDRRALV